MFLKSSLQDWGNVRTIGQHSKEDAMVAQVKDIVTRSRSTLIEDLFGVCALFATLYLCLAFTAF